MASYVHCTIFLASFITICLVQGKEEAEFVLSETTCLGQLRKNSTIYERKTYSFRAPPSQGNSYKYLNVQPTVKFEGEEVKCMKKFDPDKVSKKPTITLKRSSVEYLAKQKNRFMPQGWFPFFTVLCWGTGLRPLPESKNTAGSIPVSYLYWLVYNIKRDTFKDGFSGQDGDEVVKYEAPLSLLITPAVAGVKLTEDFYYCCQLHGENEKKNPVPPPPLIRLGFNESKFEDEGNAFPVSAICWKMDLKDKIDKTLKNPLKS